MRRLLRYYPSELRPYINWVYFFHAWGLPPRFAGIATVHDCPACRRSWVNSFMANERAQAHEAERLHSDALKLLGTMDNDHEASALFELLPVWSRGEDLIVVKAVRPAKENIATDDSLPHLRQTILPLLRQQSRKDSGHPYLCLADFISPQPPDEAFVQKRLYADEADPDVNNTLGIFATAVHSRTSHPDNDPYLRMLTQTLCDRLAEAAAEKMHQEVRRQFWGYAPNENLQPQELFSEQYQGLRPAVGYPSLPDQSILFLLNQMAGFGEIGIRLTENGMMLPHAAVAGLMFGHPAAQHFSVGRIDEVQLTDYARRREMPPDKLRRFLSRNLQTR